MLIKVDNIVHRANPDRIRTALVTGLSCKKDNCEQQSLLFVQSNYFVSLRSEDVDHGSDEFDLRPLCSNIRCYNQRVSNLADY